MSDLADPAQSPSVHDDDVIMTGSNNCAPGGEKRGIKRPAAADDTEDGDTAGAQEGEKHGIKRPRLSTAADDDDDDDKPRGQRGRQRNHNISFMQNKARRQTTFTKRKGGIMKKASELSILTGTQVLLMVVSETGLAYTFATPKLQPIVAEDEGKNLIRACLNAPEPAPETEIAIDGESDVESTEVVSHTPTPAPPSTNTHDHTNIMPEQQQ
ncbi:transcription factor of the MADS box [Pseudocyphellaria aurata]|nr:transcription factor of the MADS box [Pseudocyphellaria aurata]